MSIPADLLLQPRHVIVQKERKLSHVEHVQVSSRQGGFVPRGTAVQKAGMRYENRVGQKVAKLAEGFGAEVAAHVWINAGKRNYQPDLFLIFPSGAVLLFEIKQTWVDTRNQIEVYKELLHGLGFGSITGCTICKNLTPETPRSRIIHSFEDIKEGSIWMLRL